MFKDYYKILNIPQSSTLAEIKQAYRYLSLKWHPDRNSGKDTTEEMLAINEAYSILSDEVKRQRYDEEYIKFKQSPQCTSPVTTYNYTDFNGCKRQRENSYQWTYSYTVHDERVKKDIDEAKENARKLVEEFMRGLRENSRAAAKGAWEEMRGYVLVLVIFIIISLIIILIK